MRRGFPVSILWNVALVGLSALASGQEERPNIYEIPEKIEPQMEAMGGREAIEALIGNTVLIHSPAPRILYLRPDGTGVSRDANPPRKREPIKWAINDIQSLCIMGVNDEKVPSGASCLRVTLSGGKVSIWVPITGPDDAGAAILLEGNLVQDNPLNL